MLKSFKFILFALAFFLLAQVSASGTITSKTNSTSDSSSNDSSNSNDNGGSSNSTKTSTSNSSGSSSKISIPSNAARGMITMTEPPVAQNFVAGWAIGTVASMKWTFDKNLKLKPDNISITAIRQEGSAIVTYNIGLGLPGDTTNFDWDTGAFAKNSSNPPLVESDNYKLYIYDTARSYLAGAPAGGLNPYTRQFRLYQGSDGSSNICLQCLPGGLQSSSSMPRSEFYLLIIAALFHL